MISPMESVHLVRGPWSLATSKLFWEGFAPSALPKQAALPKNAALPEQTAQPEQTTDSEIRAVFLSDSDWTRVETVVTQDGNSARISVAGPGDLQAATDQVRRFLSLDIDGTTWPDVALRDPVIADAQAQLPGLRPCGFYSPYDAAVWAVLSTRIQMRQAARIKATIQNEFGDDGAFPNPEVLRTLAIDLPGRKLEYLHAVADAALEGRLGGAYLRTIPAEDALREVQKITGLGPFAAELVVIRGANFADVLPKNEARLEAEIVERYDSHQSFEAITDNWAPFRSWAGVHLRALREYRTHEIERGRRA
jgi:DNA-3-methyladenine glycosylase II